MAFKYGVSFNCNYGSFDEVGGGGEGDSTIDYVGNDLDKIEQYLIDDAKEQKMIVQADREHELVDRHPDVGGKTVSVIVEHESDGHGYNLCVIFEEADLPIVIE